VPAISQSDPTADEAWSAEKLGKDSIIVDIFQGQLKSTMKCKFWGKVS